MKKLRNLSISNFKNFSRKSFRLLVFFGLFLIFNYFIGLELKKVDSVDNLYAKVKWQEFYETDKNSLDLVFLGSSYSYRSFDASIFDEKLNLESFNMGSPLQKPIESYYVLKETLKYQNPSYLVYDINWAVFNKDKYFNTKVWNFDNMKSSFNKIGYLLNVFDIDQYLNATFKSVRYHDNFEKLFRIMIGQQENINNQNVEEYVKKYKGKGFVINNEILSINEIDKIFENRIKNPRVYDWDEEQLIYFNKIVGLCEKENIRLILETAPVNPVYLENYNEYWYDYSSIHNFVVSLANDKNLTYFDYNMINAAEKILVNSDFADTNHLNYSGAEKISVDFADRLKLELLELK